MNFIIESMLIKCGTRYVGSINNVFPGLIILIAIYGRNLFPYFVLFNVTWYHLWLLIFQERFLYPCLKMNCSEFLSMLLSKVYSSHYMFRGKQLFSSLHILELLLDSYRSDRQHCGNPGHLV